MDWALGGCVKLNDAAGGHYSFLLTDLVGNPPSAIIVNASTWHRRKDQTTILMPNDCNIIQHKSIIEYRFAVTLQVWQLDRVCVASYPPISDKLLQKLVYGLVHSEMTPQKIINFYLAFYPPPERPEP
jgi:hypothetical protein